jgi:SAM-dependent methyltransferase
MSPYPLPFDVKEMSRQALWHELQREVYGGYSNIDWRTEKIPQKVLEIGCGSGIWSASMADYFASLGHPNVEFTGLDIVETYGDMKNVNFKFVKHSIHYPLPFPPCTFDYVISRDMMLTTPTRSMYNGIVDEILRVLKPGGFFEIQCSTNPSTPGNASLAC